MKALILLTFSFVLNAAAAEDVKARALAEFHTLVKRMASTEGHSGARIAQKIYLKQIEQKLLGLGLTSEELAVERNRALAQEAEDAQQMVDQVITSEQAEARSNLVGYGPADKWAREKLVHKIIEHPTLEGLKFLIDQLHTYETDIDLRREYELAALKSLSGHKGNIESGIRRKVLERIHLDSMSDLDNFGLDESLDGIYREALDTAVDVDIEATKEILRTQSQMLNNCTKIKVLIRALNRSPAYADSSLVIELYDRNSQFADYGYMFDLIPLLARLPMPERARYISGGLYYINRLYVPSEKYFDHPVFVEPEFLTLLSRELEAKYTAGYIYNIMDQILLRPEYIHRFDIFEPLMNGYAHVLSQGLSNRPNLSSLPGAEALIGALYEAPRASKDVAADTLLQALLAQREPYHLDYLRALLPHTVNGIFSFTIFRSPLINQSVGKELLDLFFKQNLKIPHSELFKGLMLPEAVAFPYLVDLMIKSGQMTPEEKKKILELPHWKVQYRPAYAMDLGGMSYNCDLMLRDQNNAVQGLGL